MVGSYTFDVSIHYTYVWAMGNGTKKIVPYRFSSKRLFCFMIILPIAFAKRTEPVPNYEYPFGFLQVRLFSEVLLKIFTTLQFIYDLLSFTHMTNPFYDKIKNVPINANDPFRLLL